MSSTKSRGRLVDVVAICAAIAFAVTLVSEASGQVPAPPTRAQYVEAIEPICHRETKDMQAAVHGFRADFKHKRFARAGAKILRSGKIVHRSVAEIATVPRPPADAATIEAWLDKTDDWAADIERIGRMYITGHLRKFNAANARYKRDGRAANALVAGWGFRSCLINKPAHSR